MHGFLQRNIKGIFILRIEDTDRTRLVPGAVRAIIEDLTWFNITIDEGPSREDLKRSGDFWEEAPEFGGKCGSYIQSLRTEKYRQAAEDLISKGHAYRCDCTPEMIQKERLEQMARKEVPGYSGYCRTRNVQPDVPHVVRLKVPFRKSITLDDAVKGRVHWDQIQQKDPVILKSDYFPTYHLAVVVDDHYMEISHIIRGDDWLSSVPIHILLYEMFGWEQPIFAHLPNILGSDGKKLSKRHGATSVENFQKDGYLPEAIFNYSVLIGWSPGSLKNQKLITDNINTDNNITDNIVNDKKAESESEVYSIDQIKTLFSLEGVNVSGGVFDYNKLNWLNGVYIRKLDTEEFLKKSIPFFKNQYDFESIRTKFVRIASIIKERIKTLNEIPEMVSFLRDNKLERDLPNILSQKGMDKEKASNILSLAHKYFKDCTDWTALQIEDKCNSILQDSLIVQSGLKKGAVLMTLRIAILGKAHTPPLFDSIEALGKENALNRILECKQEL